MNGRSLDMTGWPIRAGARITVPAHERPDGLRVSRRRGTVLRVHETPAPRVQYLDDRTQSTEHWCRPEQCKVVKVRGRARR